MSTRGRGMERTQ